jgi:signal transduction histidine kinase
MANIATWPVVARCPRMPATARARVHDGLMRVPWRWESAVAVVAAVSTAAAFWITSGAKFLEYPHWLAVQKADLILGPVFVGLYWRHRRPDNRLGVLLIALGLLSIPYIFESIASPWPFTLGTVTEYALEPMTVAVILAFPNGHLNGALERLILAVLVIGVTLQGLMWLVMVPQFTPFFSISGCRELCPADPLYSSSPSWLSLSFDVVRALGVSVWLATAGLLVWRFATGTPPRRRALAIGAPIAMCYLLISATYQVQQLLNPHLDVANPEPLTSFVQWAVAASRSAIWYGFLLALVAAELFAGRTLRRLVRDSLGRPSLRALEGMLRGPLGDPGLRLGFWRSRRRDWVDADGEVLAPRRSDQRLTEFQRDRRPAIAIVHDDQLSDDPELLQAAGTVALLALENAELDAAWRQSLGELADSRARLVRAGERERRKLERDLHDGAQQRLVAASINLAVADELADNGNPDLRERVNDATREVEEALAELRELAHGIYPTALGRWGLGRALDLLAARHRNLTVVSQTGVGRFRPEVEAAIYYCCLEAVQNASKHAGRDAHITIRLYSDDKQLHLEVRDDGPGFDVSQARDGIGLQNMRDRLGAVGGHAHITSQPGQGTLVAATVPIGERSAVRSPR